jgi:cytochrome c-type biogenesis protein
MDIGVLGFALAAGAVAAVNPCGFAMLPGYLALVVTGEASRTPVANPTEPATTSRTAVARALTATAAMTAGFLLVFGAFGLVIAPLTSSIEQYLPAVTVLIGAALLALGCWLLAGREITLLLPRPGRGAPTRRLGSMVGYGVAYALASVSCTIAPFLAVTAATFRSDSVPKGVLAYLTYGLGMAMVVGVLAVAIALAGATAASGVRRVLPWLNRICGALLIVTGLYVGYYGLYELRVFFAGAPTSDPIVDGAGAVQAVLAGWVDALGVLPFALALAALVAGTVLAAVLGARRAARRPH